MADQDRVCCMCGDIGFADKLFKCSSCRFRFQHLYCSNYFYGSQELLSPSSSSSSITKSLDICDWCQSEGRNSSTTNKHHSGSYKRSLSSSSSSSSMDHHRNLHIHSEYTSGERIKQHQDHQTGGAGERGTPKNNNNNNSGIPSPRPSAHRRYKLLKDVMC
ncbi:uncharacterized protein LOC110721503 [Chenopodium quinoa]|uniref:uncharacterized protein LOC110721503 n=1 Tax=Chenopodium quinoa TaxID=63459 RepID=UPI000B78714D|nr:uncharacterized protein LOC110721503 [Chenopodium quinoa]